MAIKVTFVENPLGKGGKVMARVVRGSVVSFDTLLTYMAKDTALETNDMRVMFQQLVGALVFYLPEGVSVATPMGNFRMNAHSRSTGTNGDRALDQNGLHLTIKVDPELQRMLHSKCKVEIIETPPVRGPRVLSVHNVDTGNGVSEFASGHIMHIGGSRLSFDQTDDELGVFLVGADGEAAVRCTVYSRAGSSNIDCKIPEVGSGTYLLEVRTRPTQREIRTGHFKAPLNIA